MASRKYHLFVIGCLLWVGLAAACTAAQYRITVDVDWDGTDPSGVIVPVPGPHLSHLGIATHNAATTFWALGMPATPGIATMAVTGCIACGSPTWIAEFDAAGVGADKFHVFADEVNLAAPSTTQLEFSIEKSHSFITIASMVGPSPDWFVGVSSFDLRPGGRWLSRAEIPMVVYDGGIKSSDVLVFDPSGPNSPVGTPIARLSEVSAHPFGTVPVGKFTLELVSASVPIPLGGLLLFGPLLAVMGMLLTRASGRRPSTDGPTAAPWG